MAFVLAQSQPTVPSLAPQQTFRSGRQLVEVDVRVLKDGKFVTDLTAADFQLTEDGVPQKIETVILIAPPAPAAPSAPAPSAPDVPGATPSPTRSPRQTWLFVFDTNHLTPGPFARAREAAATFISDKFRDGDLGGVVVDGKMANNRLTSDRAELKAAVEAMKMPGNLRSRQLDQREWPRLQDEFEAFRIANNDQEALRIATARACSDDPDACRRGSADLQVREKALRMVGDYQKATQLTLSTVSALANGLTKVPGAKTVVFFSEGFVLERMEAILRDAVGRAATAGAHFYTIDVRGLNKGSVSQIIDQPYANSPINSGPMFDMQTDGTNSLALDTGGFAVRNENNFGRALDQIQQDTGTYYVIAYSPTNTAFDGKYRSIGVKVSRPDVKVRARRGYLAIEPAALLSVSTRLSDADTRPKAPSGPVGPEGAEVSPKPLSEELGAKAERLSSESPPPIPSEPPPSVPALSETTKLVESLKQSDFARLRPDAGFVETRSASASPADRGWSAYEKGDVETAAKELGTAAAAPDARPWIVYALGLSQFALRQHKEAAQSWERVRREVPEFEPVYFNLADAYSLQQDLTTALKVLRDAEGRWPNDAEVANAIGVIHVRRGSLDAAVDAFERATRVQPGDALGYFNLARTCQMRMLKSQRYDRQTEKWIGGDEDRRKATAAYERYLSLGGPYERQAREALASLAWK
jgi:VWFA-related protein